jgi:beta-glucosidase
MEERIEALLQQMTLEEKVSMLAGANLWYTVPVERLGIPAIKMTDGPNGARGESPIGWEDITSACFPVGIALASTWDTDLVGRVAQALGEETKSKSCHILLAPTVNIHRSPLGGRNFECYSEDPYLTARMAVAYIKGLQSQKVGATVKHFICNDAEFERNSLSSEVGPRALREIYLPPFKAAVQEAGSWAVMSSYNRVNGTYASDSAYFLTDILKKEWGFDGIVMSDWGGTYSTVPSGNSGLDLEMPGPANWRGDKLLKAVKNGEVSEDQVDDSVRRLLRTIIRSGMMDNPVNLPEQSINKPEHRALAREAAADAIVLLKNNGILPLDAKKIKTLAIIGPNAKVARSMGGGSSQVSPHYTISPFEGILNKVGDSVKIEYEIGCSNDKMLATLNSSWLKPAAGDQTHGLTAEFFNNLNLEGAPAKTVTVRSTHQVWFGGNPIEADDFSARFTGTFTAPETGTYGFSLTYIGVSRFYMDDQVVFDYWKPQTPDTIMFGAGRNLVLFEKEMTAGQTVKIRMEYSQGNTKVMHYGLRLACRLPSHNPSIERAAKLAAKADVALLFVGANGELESEGSDRPDMELYGDQVALIEAVTAANKNTVIVLNTGSPYTMNWLDKVAAVVEAWFPGQEAGNAIADVLFGDVNPSGKLTETFPVRLEDNPAFINYPGENGKVLYGEGIFVGYRYYEKKKIKPLFPFGFGLSYTTFAYNNLRLSTSELQPGDMLQVSVDVTNTGKRAGKEVVQLYVRDVVSRLVRPEKELKGFAKVALKPGETKTVTLTLDADALTYYDDKPQEWIAEAGEFQVLIGSSSADIRATASFKLAATVTFGGEGEKRAAFGVKTPIGQLLADDRCYAVLDEMFPGFLNMPEIEMAKGFSLEQVAGFVPEVLTPEVLKAVDEALAKL